MEAKPPRLIKTTTWNKDELRWDESVERYDNEQSEFEQCTTSEEDQEGAEEEEIEEEGDESEEHEEEEEGEKEDGTDADDHRSADEEEVEEGLDDEEGEDETDADDPSADDTEDWATRPKSSGCSPRSILTHRKPLKRADKARSDLRGTCEAESGLGAYLPIREPSGRFRSRSAGA